MEQKRSRPAVLDDAHRNAISFPRGQRRWIATKAEAGGVTFSEAVRRTVAAAMKRDTREELEAAATG